MILSELPPPPDRKTGWPWEIRENPSSNVNRSFSLPRVSIVTPSYNQGRFIEATIRSVLLQDYPNLEYWVIDGGSNDESLEIIQKYSPWLMGWVSEKDLGQADAINKGWQRATGEFLGWINADDLLTPGSIMTAVSYLQNHPEAGLVFGDLEHIDDQGKILILETYKDFDLVEIVREVNWISQPGNLLKRSMFERVGLLDTTLHFQMDFDYWLRIALVSKIGYLRQPLAQFRQHPEGKSSNRAYMAAMDIMQVYGKLFQQPTLPPDLLSVATHAWGSAHLYAANAWYTSDRFLEAYQELWQAIQTYPQVMMSRLFRRMFPKLILLSLLGGRQSTIFKIVQRLVGKFPTNHMITHT
jgi:glycosyltransferase involved in cell wall biosynthesis